MTFSRSTPRLFWAGFAVICACAAFAQGAAHAPVRAAPASQRAVTAKPKDSMKPIRLRVLVLNYDPVIEAEQGKRLHEVCGWRDSHELVKNHIADLRDVSYGQVRVEVKEWRDVDGFPPKKDGFVYTDDGYLAAWRANKGWHQPDSADYNAILKTFNVAERIDKNEFDEVWVMSSPYTGLWESTMAGRGAYWCNSEPLAGVQTNRLFVVMGFNYERDEAEMIHDWGHRTESVLNHVYGEWNNKTPKTAWDRFSLAGKDADADKPAGAGNCHFPPNGIKDYDYASDTKRLSNADDWLTYPKLTGKSALVDKDNWGDVPFPVTDSRKRGGKIDYQRGYLKWWFGRVPHAKGRASDGNLNNWWPYIADLNANGETRP